MLRQRVITAAILLACVLASLFLLPGWAWATALGAMILAGAREWGRLAGWRAPGLNAFTALVAVSGAVLLWLGLRGPAGERVVVAVSAGALAFWLFAALPWLARLRHVRGSLAMAMAGWWVLVPAWLAGAWLQSRPWLLLALLAVVWISDTAAYFAGRAFGRHKLAPAIRLGLARPPGLPGLLTAGAAGAFLGLTALGILGDLFESWIKRGAGVKDSGTLLPGHGGVLDRIDALTASLPLAALAALTVFAR